MPDTDHRLPRPVLPVRYELELAPDLDAATFRGEVTIELEVVEPTDTVTLHAVDLRIDAAWVTVDGRHLDASPELHPEVERLVLQLPDRLPKGQAELHVRFDGVLNDQLVGFYRSSFTAPGPDGADVEHALAVTQFESTHARRAFPCFDEPDLKATFGITLVVPGHLLAVSNAAEVSRRPQGDGTDRITFADTIPMSTYLVAFVVGPLEATAVREVPGVGGPIPLRVVHPPGRGRLCDFALDVADTALRFFEDYYGLPYPGDKVDLVAVPDFAFGAMENLGCITFREVLLLVDPDTATQPELQRVADVINHELAHMWFGDLVTMRWWNGIWLNEAFATFMEVTATDHFRPDWDAWTGFGLLRSAAFDTDALDSTRPIEFEVVTPADAEAMFDVLTYEKGASVVRMLERYLGPEAFRDGIRAYLRRHALGNTETADLWDALEASTGEPVRRIMDAWILQGGHPRVVVEPRANGLALRQERFRYSSATGSAEAPGDAGRSGSTGNGWPVPLVVTSSGPDGTLRTDRLLLDEPAVLDLGHTPRWVQANTGGDGFFRTSLPAAWTGALGAARRPALERFVLVEDTWAELLAGRVGVAEVEALLAEMAADEADPAVWRRLAGVVRGLWLLRGPDRRPTSATLARRVAEPALLRVAAGADEPGAAGERHRDVRGVLVELLGTVGASDEVRRAAARVTGLGTDLAGPADRSDAGGAAATPAWLPGTADPALTAAALDVVASVADGATHAGIEERWRHAGTPQDEVRHLYALADTPDPAAFGRTLRLALEEVRTQNAPYLLRRALAHPDLGGAAWSFVEEHWSVIGERFPANALPRMLEGVRSVTDPGLAGRISGFLADHPTEVGAQVVDQHLERMAVTVAAAARLSR